jgi:hypothetical protein
MRMKTSVYIGLGTIHGSVPPLDGFGNSVNK